MSQQSAATDAVLEAGSVRLRPTGPADCDFVVAVERHPDNRKHVEHWSAAQHRASLERPGAAHWIVEDDGHPVGYVLLEDTDDPNGSILLRRIAVIGKGRGYGRTALLLAARYCFDELRCHRLWLNVAAENTRAGALYESLGFVQEGVARESVRKGDQFVSMRVLSLLASEYRASLEPGGSGRS